MERVKQHLQTIIAIVAIASPILSAAYVVGMVRAELAGLRRDVDYAHARIDKLYDRRT